MSMWKEKYKVGVGLIDTQHKVLFDRLSAFIQVVQNEDDWNGKLEKVKETLEFLKDYVVYHFDDEEAYQERINYPDIEKHKKMHASFKDGVNGYVELLNEGNFGQEDIQELSAKLMTWLIMHVGRMDQKLGEYAKEQGVELE